MGSVLTNQEEFSVSPFGGCTPRVAGSVWVLETRYCKGEWGKLGRPVVVAPLFPLNSD